MRIANDTLYGLGAGIVWSRDVNTAYRAVATSRRAGCGVNNYHAYPAHAAFGGYKQSGVGRENHKMMLDHHQQTKKHVGSATCRPTPRLLLMTERVALTPAAGGFSSGLTAIHGR
jgi:acyl-CoA reductase-like NAD-dependent aldehyde dehydrogenase